MVHQNSEEDIPKAYVLKFEVDPDYLQLLIDSSYDFSNFAGTITRYSLDAFVNNTNTNKVSGSGKNYENFGGVDECMCDNYYR